MLLDGAPSWQKVTSFTNVTFGSQAVIPRPYRKRLYLRVEQTFLAECPVLGAFQKYPEPVQKVRV
jgi:hypothetical protein